MDDTAVIRDFLGMGAFVDHANHEEEGTCDDGMVDHLDPATVNTLDVERKKAQYDVTHMGHRGIGDQPLDLLLHHGH